MLSFATALPCSAELHVAAWGGNLVNPTTSLSNVAAIASGWYHTLALQSNGVVVAWGQDFYNQSTVPANLPKVAAISANNYNSLALLSNGTVVAWGLNDVKQTNVPTGLSNVVAIAVGGQHSLALRADGRIIPWGVNTYGQTNVPATIPTFVLRDTFAYANGTLVGAPGSPWTAHSSPGSSPVAVVNGQILLEGTVGAEDVSAPLAGAPYSPAGGASLYASFKINLTALPDGGTYFAHFKDASTVFRARVWASTNNAPPGTFRLGMGNNSDTANTQLAANLSLGTTYTVVVRLTVATGIARLWVNPGLESDGGATAADTSTGVSISAFAFRQDLGGGTVLVRDLRVGTSFAAVTSPAVKSIAAGRFHSLALLENGRVLVWGGRYGETNVPTGLSDAVAVAGGYSHCLALRSNGTVVAWGTNLFNSGQLNVPAGLSNVVAIATTAFHSLALRSDGTVVGWGENFSGESVAPPGLTNAVAIVAGWGQSAALAPFVAPSITVQPQAQAVVCDEYLDFSASVGGTLPLSYQWHLNNIPINGATDRTLTVFNVTCADAGNYTLLVTNSGGSDSSSNALATVAPGLPLSLTTTSVAVSSFAVVPAPDTNAVTVLRSCGPVNIRHQGDFQSHSGCRTIITRYYEGVDSCNRTNIVSQTITVSPPPVILGFTSTQSVQPDGVQVVICADVTGSGLSYSWSVNTGNPISTFKSGNCFYLLLDPTDETAVSVNLNVSNPCGGTGGNSPPVTTCSICLSRGAPSLLAGTAGSGSGPQLNTINCGTLGANTRWFKLIATNETGVVIVSTEGSTNDTLLAIYTGPLGQLVRVDCNDDINSSNRQSRVAFTAVQGNVYWIAVDPRANAAGLRVATGFEPRIESYGLLPDGSFELRSSVAPPIPYRLQMTTNFAAGGTLWSTVLITNLTTNFPYLYYHEPNVMNFQRRYYRLAPVP